MLIETNMLLTLILNEKGQQNEFYNELQVPELLLTKSIQKVVGGFNEFQMS